MFKINPIRKIEINPCQNEIATANWNFQVNFWHADVKIVT